MLNIPHLPCLRPLLPPNLNVSGTSGKSSEKSYSLTQEGNSANPASPIQQKRRRKCGIQSYFPFFPLTFLVRDLMYAAKATSLETGCGGPCSHIMSEERVRQSHVSFVSACDCAWRSEAALPDSSPYGNQRGLRSAPHSQAKAAVDQYDHLAWLPV